MMLTCINVYHKPECSDTRWLGFLKSTNGLAYNLNEQPHEVILHGFFTRLILFLPSYYMQTFQEAFYMRFFTYRSTLFGVEVKDLRSRYVSYMTMELKNRIMNFLLSHLDVRCKKQFREGIQYLS